MSRRSRWTPLVYILALGSVAGLVAVAAGAMQQRAGASAGQASLARSLEDAVNAANTRAAVDLSAAGVVNDYSWIADWKASGGNARLWRATVFSAPSRDGGETNTLVEVSRPQLCESTGDHLYALQRSPSGWRLGREIPETEPTAYRVRSHKAVVAFDRAARRVTIDNTVTIARVRSASVGPILRLNCYYRIRAVRIGAKPHRFTQSGGFVALAPFDTPAADVRFEYGAPLPATGETFLRADEAALTAYWYPHIARLPATSDIAITGPASWKCIGPGRFAGKQSGSGVATWRWENRVPVCYITVAGGDYHEYVRRASAATAKVWLLDANETRAAETLDVATRALDWFAGRFGRYPYPDFTVVESRVFPPALEGYSFTLAGSGSIPGAVSHEISHTWWGGLVPNTYTRSMWNESLATYTDGMFGRSAEAGKDAKPGNGAYGSAESLPTTVSLMRATDAMNPEHSAVGYGKGSLVLEQLERLIGTDKMTASLRALVSRHQSGADADWQDIVDAVASTVGSAWRGFFPSWLERSDVPRYDLRDVAASPTQDGYVVTGAIVQQKPAFWSMAELLVRTEGGGSQSVETPVRSERTSFSLTTRLRPLSVVLDPKGEMLRSGPRDITATIGAPPAGQPRRL